MANRTHDRDHRLRRILTGRQGVESARSAAARISRERAHRSTSGSGSAPGAAW
ncbi:MULTISPECIES: hypothetical protein [Streptomyces]|uniref:Uncharacterized protein n=1 Tax=Streptomyces griseiscabiei TaxID=2993540 RepID=A0ABU4LDN2_9ACTN|nr:MULTISPECIES: hypothetical protein [Streptomyces]MBZ3908357.1 hypothetical protein [Streptomyces griseiscabiei]MDX2913871.1 hypothetical protein [Streptomyces griseiscabiei]